MSLSLVPTLIRGPAAAESAAPGYLNRHSHVSFPTPLLSFSSHLSPKLGTKGRAKAELTFDLLGIVRVNPASRMNLIELGQLYHLKRPLVLSVLLLGSVGSPGSSIIDVRIIVVFPTPILPLHVRNIL